VDGRNIKQNIEREVGNLGQSTTGNSNEMLQKSSKVTNGNRRGMSLPSWLSIKEIVVSSQAEYGAESWYSVIVIRLLFLFSIV